MHISTQFRDRILKDITKKPLEQGEYRLIPRSGSHFVSLDPTWDTDQYLFKIAFKDTTVYIFKKIS